jgi:uncharacterized repeat protein (TIGR03803 family)
LYLLGISWTFRSGHRLRRKFFARSVASLVSVIIAENDCHPKPGHFEKENMETWQKSIKFRLWAAALLLPVFGVQAGVTFTSLYSFTGANDGSSPQARLTQGSDGYFYGTTLNGGTNFDGTVFKISTSGTLTSLYSFTGGNDGSSPQAGLVEGSDGYFYGTAQSGGQPAFGGPAGTVFKISTNGVLTNLYSFTTSFNGVNDGAYPEAGLVEGSDGYFYGTTFQGGTYGFSNSGTNGFGTVFKISTNGVLTSLYPFSGGNDGANPVAGLAQGSDGYFYGTTQSGGMHNFGTVFKISTNGALTSLYSFTGGNDGGGPLGELVQGGDSYLFGTTPGGGTSGFGTVFKISTSGTLTGLYSFTGSDDGVNPQAGLVRGSDGNFYGTTQSGGTNGGGGTIFKITAKGVLTTLYSFTGGTDGSSPQAAMVQGNDGDFYGTTVNGGQSGAGTVFRLTVVLGPPQLTIVPSAANVTLKWPINPVGFILQSTTNLASPVVWATNFAAPVVINGQNTVTNPISGSQMFFRLAQ